MDVSGTTFNHVLLAVNLLTMFQTVTGLYLVTEHHHFVLWVNGLVWLVYMMYAVVGYRDTRELCGYCTYSMAGQGLHFVVLCVTSEGEMPWYLVGLMLVVTGMVLMSTQAARMDRKYTAKQKAKEEAEKKKQRIEQERLDKLAEESMEVIECPGYNSHRY